MIDRKSVVQRHDPIFTTLKTHSPLSAGNGVFCFTADFTGLQTFYNDYCEAPDSFPLCTMAEWGWHSYPRDDSADLRLTPYNTYGRTVYYPADNTGQEELFKKIRVNAHKFHLGKIGFAYNDNKLTLNECTPVKQTLSLWEGLIYSEFMLRGNSIKTKTFVHPHEDAVYLRVDSSLLLDGALSINIEFPYGSHKKTGADFTSAHLHITKKRGFSDNSICAEREMDGTKYSVSVNGSGFLISLDEKLHNIVLTPKSQCVELYIRFTPVYIPSFSPAGIEYETHNAESFDTFDAAEQKCKSFWERYWSSGGFMEISGSKDAFELERRIILSQYLIAIQSRGKLPPAETALTCNSWYGKFHLEMHFWHHAHFPLWGRTEELKRSLDYYKKILPSAKETASSQGYSGARWPKMCDPSGKNTPSSVAVLLIWQQPHPIMFAELVWQTEKNNDFLREYREVIIETAEFMKSFIHFDGERYVIGPPYIPVQERHDPKIVLNAAFELEYFRWAFRTADEWLCRLGEKKRYSETADLLSLPPVSDGLYQAHENCPNTFSEFPFNTDHPSMLGMYGILNSEKVNSGLMSATLDKVLKAWDKTTFYGWDFSMMAMTACRLGRFKDALDILLMDSPKNTWLENGHNMQKGDDALPLYLPGNGGLLLAAAMLACTYENTPGFANDFVIKKERIFTYL
ncbi:MAG: hypothetical protein FWB83_01560 [Treponema sp.]|nr:hypothetical protein [Treponema sp.]